ncbi:general transcription factor IIIA, b isoform X2 [Triplophysa dalaica]|uniref:general transcription factor IIIA, b isoform X2 n=1 Tax=Triplophysa dalaica TaxID=1582913 RepID=UPI0024DF3440|nr:general transcription factor IIIA, b isoform X2 [Triplophysa dalaica]
MGERLQHPDKHFMCSFANCKSSFSKMWKLEAHYCKHTGLKPFACGNCDKSYNTRYLLTRHQLSHSGEKPYLRERALECCKGRHLTVISADHLFLKSRCSVSGCSDAFSTPGALKNHVAHVHQHNQRFYVCNYQNCGKAFGKKKQLKIHTCKHTKEFPFECDFKDCDKKFSTSKDLKLHEKVHKGYPCAEEYCYFKGKTWSEYQKHRKAVHRETLPCDQCKRIFHHAWFLQKHKQWVHSGERRMFKCTREGCQETYTTNFNLQNHVLAFHEKRCDFICLYVGCGKAFAMEESLRRHSVVHNPQKTKLQKPKTKQHKTRSKFNTSEAAKVSKALQNVSLNKAI